MTKVFAAIPAIILDKRRVRPDGSYPIKLRLTLNREQRYYPLGENLMEEDWLKIQNAANAEGKLKVERLKEIRIKLFGSSGYLQIAKRIIDKLPFFSFTEFEKHFFKKNQQTQLSNNVYDHFDNYVEKLKSQNRVGSASCYKTAKNSLQLFKKTLRFDELNADFLEMYERKNLENGMSPSTIGLYLRSLRTIVNQAIEQGITTKENYPFGRNRYIIPATLNTKKALSLEEIGKIYNFKDEEFSSKDKAKDFWILSYLCNGINIKDICLLKWQNIKDGKISFIRAKTERSKKASQKEISVIMSSDIRIIIDKWGNSKKGNTDFVFPILSPGLSSQRERDLIQGFTKTTNKWMKRVATDLGIETNLTTYVARHSYSTVLKRGGASIEYISESLGHKDLRTTEIYLDSFEDVDKIKNASLLTAFKNG
jgi:integrase/recombinase XerD